MSQSTPQYGLRLQLYQVSHHPVFFSLSAPNPSSSFSINCGILSSNVVRSHHPIFLIHFKCLLPHLESNTIFTRTKFFIWLEKWVSAKIPCSLLNDYLSQIMSLTVQKSAANYLLTTSLVLNKLEQQILVIQAFVALGMKS